MIGRNRPRNERKALDCGTSSVYSFGSAAVVAVGLAQVEGDTLLAVDDLGRRDGLAVEQLEPVLDRDLGVALLSEDEARADPDAGECQQHPDDRTAENALDIHVTRAGRPGPFPARETCLQG